MVENKINLEREYKKELGDKLNTRVIGTGKKAFSIKMFRKGFILKRANRGYIFLDSFDLWWLKETIEEFMKKREVIKSLKDA